jgi:hydroxymethylglutaryl-CoA synthase
MRPMKPSRDVGIVGYGAYVPRFRLASTEVSRLWSGSSAGGPVASKSVPGLDEDVITMALEAARNALRRGRVAPESVGAVWVGSESHPYAVKPTGTVVAEAIGAVPATLAADLEFACKAGTEALQAAFGLVGSSMTDCALAIGMDAAQGRPGDALEYTAGAGGAAFLVGPASDSVALLEASASYVTDTPDFWRRQHAHYPEHGARFTGVPAYFKHVGAAGRGLLEALGAKASDYTHAVFHQPNTKFPAKAGKELGFVPAQLRVGMLANEIGNTYAGAALLGLTAILDEARPGDRVLVVSFGSGAGSDAFSFRVTERIAELPREVPTTRQYVGRAVPLDYAGYARHRRKILVD